MILASEPMYFVKLHVRFNKTVVASKHNLVDRYDMHRFTNMTIKKNFCSTQNNLKYRST